MNRNQLFDWCKDDSNCHTLSFIQLSSYKGRSIVFRSSSSRIACNFFKQLIKYLWKKVFNSEISSNEEIEHEGVNLFYYLFGRCDAISTVYGNTSAIDNVDIYYQGMLEYMIIPKTKAFAVDCKVGHGINTRLIYCINCYISRLSLRFAKAPRMINYYLVKSPIAKLHDCYNCIDCINCASCSDCTLCMSCTDCCNSILCTDCDECNCCNNCKSCEGLDMCDNCTECRQSQYLDICQHCKNHCFNCTGCVDCKSCKNCETCNSCVNCDSIQLCANCNGCKNNCSECTDCVNCVNCVHCTECKICSDCVNCTKCKMCTYCNECVTCVKQISKKQTDTAMFSRSHQHISEEQMFFAQPFIVNLDDDGQRVEINGKIIQYFDDENNLVFQGTCQYECPVTNWNNALNFKLGQGWIYYPDIQRKCCYIILSTNSKYNVTLSDLIKIHDTDVLVEYIQKQSKLSNNSVVYVYDRNGKEVYKSLKF